MTPKLRTALILLSLVSVGMILAAPFVEPPKTGVGDSPVTAPSTQKPESSDEAVAQGGPGNARPLRGVVRDRGAMGADLRVPAVYRDSCRERCASVDGRSKRKCLEACKARKAFESCRSGCTGEDPSECIQACRAGMTKP